MTEPPAQPYEHPSPARDRVRLDVLLIALAAGPAAWIVQLAGDYALASVACRPDDTPRALPPAGGWGGEHLLLLAINLACLALCLAGGGAAWLCWRRSSREKAGETPAVVEVGEAAPASWQCAA
jgi:hypothetical protein